MDRRLDVISFEFSQNRGECETEFARAMIAAPHLGAAVAELIGLDAEHFQVNLDMRLVFCGCAVAHRYGRECVLRITSRALEQERYPLASGLESFSAEWAEANDLFVWIALYVFGLRLIRLHGLERDAREHLQFAEQLIRRGIQG